MEFPEGFKKRMNFLKEMWQLIEEYRCGNAMQDRGRTDIVIILNSFSRSFDADEHPAIQKMLEDRDKELAEEFEGEEDEEDRAGTGGKWNFQMEEQGDGEAGFEDKNDFEDLSHHGEL